LFAASVVRINEVAPDENNGEDWLELYVATTTAVNLSGWALYERGVLVKTLPAITTSQAYVVIKCTPTATPPADETLDSNGNGYFDVYIDSNSWPGSTGFSAGAAGDNVFSIRDNNGEIIDGIFWVNSVGGSVTSACESPYNVLVSTGQWSGRLIDISDESTDIYAEYAAVKFPATASVGRDSFSTDLDTETINYIAKNDWFAQNTKTMGFANDTSGQDIMPPGAITDLSVFETFESSVTLRWTASGDDGYSGTVSRYRVRYTTYSISSQKDFWNATVYDASGWVGLLPAGQTETRQIDGLLPATTYYFMIEGEDDVYLLGRSPENCPISGLTEPDSIPPGPVTNLSVSLYNSLIGSVKLTWTASGDDGYSGTVSRYRVRYTTYSISSQTDLPFAKRFRQNHLLLRCSSLSNQQYQYWDCKFQQTNSYHLSNPCQSRFRLEEYVWE